MKGDDVARETSFVELYRLLNIRPGCDVDEFKTAYRRRVALLHPDRRGDTQEDLIASERLQRLTTLYSAAMEFKRRHGRLPGALFTPLPDAADAKPAVIDPAATATGRASRWLLLALAFALGITWLIWNPDWFSDAAEPDSSTEAAPLITPNSGINKPVATPHTSIEIGMAGDVVRSIEGEPMLIGDSRWEYGPSWIRFENGSVVDWYSSPLHPLKTSASHPHSLGN